MILLGLGAVVALIAINGYFVAAEFAFVAARRSRFVEAAEQGDRRSARAVVVHRRLSFMLSGAQLGITASSLILGFLIAPVLAPLIEPVVGAIGVPEAARFGVAVAVGLVVATVVQMVVGELAPKNLAIARPERVARALAPSTLMFMRLAAPVIAVFDGAANRLLRLLRIEPVQELSGSVTTRELDLIVDTSAVSGHLSPQQAALLTRAIDFAELEASEVMVPWNRTVTIDEAATLDDLRDLMASAHSRFPVVDVEGAVRGIVHAKDLLGVPIDDYETTTVMALAHPAIMVPEAAGLRNVLRELRTHSTEMAVVVDEYGEPAGIVTLENLVEELVGDIADEYDVVDERRPVEIEPGIWSVPGDWRVDEIGRATEIELPEGDYDTIAGLVLERLERIPVIGDSIVVDGVCIEVVGLDAWAISELRLSLEPEPSGEIPVIDPDSYQADATPTGADPASDRGGERQR